ncbi:unnamed protein product, partial [Schistosoma turkestanicum]
GALTTESYQEQCSNLIISNTDIIGGIVAQHPIPGLNICSSNISYWVPGIKLVNSSDDLGQNFNTPEQVKKRFTTTTSSTSSPSCSMIMIVGRGIIESENIREEAVKYRLASIQ